MSASGDGVQRVGVRSMWPNEAYDFTPCWRSTSTCWARNSV